MLTDIGAVLGGVLAALVSARFTYFATVPVVAAGDSIDLALAATAGSDGIVVTTNTADVSSVATVSDSALVADGSWNQQTIDKYISFDTGRDWFDLPGHTGFTFGEDRSDAL